VGIAGACPLCAEGRYSITTDASTCTDCEPGTYQPSTGATACLACGRGRFSSAAASSSCTSCAAGKSTLNLTSQSACTDCTPGWFSDVAASAVCYKCAVNTYQGLSASTSCNTCPTGYTSAAGAFACTEGSAAPSAAPTTAAPTAAPSTLTPTLAPHSYPDQAAVVTVAFTGAASNATLVASAPGAIAVPVTITNANASTGSVGFRPLRGDELVGTPALLPPGFRRLAAVAINSTVPLVLLNFSLGSLPFATMHKRVFALPAIVPNSAGASLSMRVALMADMRVRHMRLEAAGAQPAVDASVFCGLATPGAGAANETSTTVAGVACRSATYVAAFSYDSRVYCTNGYWGCSCQQSNPRRSDMFLGIMWVGIALLALSCLVRVAEVVVNRDATAKDTAAGDGASAASETQPMVEKVTGAVASVFTAKKHGYGSIMETLALFGTLGVMLACTMAIDMESIDTYTAPGDNDTLRKFYLWLNNQSAWVGFGVLGWLVIVIFYGILSGILKPERAFGGTKFVSSKAAWAEVFNWVFLLLWMGLLEVMLLQSPRQGVAYLPLLPIVIVPIGAMFTRAIDKADSNAGKTLRIYHIVAAAGMAALNIVFGFVLSEQACGREYKPGSDW